MSWFTKRIKYDVLYAVLYGTYTGHFLLFIRKRDKTVDALSIFGLGMDNFEPLEIPEKDVIDGLDKKIIEPVKRIPKDLIQLLQAEWKYRYEHKDKPKKPLETK